MYIALWYVVFCICNIASGAGGILSESSVSRKTFLMIVQTKRLQFVVVQLPLPPGTLVAVLGALGSIKS